MKQYIMDIEELNAVFNEIKKSFGFYGPKSFPGEGRFSNSDKTDYAKINSFDEICWGEKTSYSARELFFPVTEDLVVINTTGSGKVTEPSAEPSIEPGIIFLRACDFNAVKRMDAHFLKGQKDAGYEAKRNMTLLAVMECIQSWDSCFCKAMGTDNADGADLNIRPLEKNRYLITNSCDTLDSHFSTFEPVYIANGNHMPNDQWSHELPEPDQSAHELEIWNRTGKRCTGCGTCNFVCPTCFCFGMRDDIRNKDTIVRQRVWSSCQVKGFAKIGTDYEYRSEQKDKMRFKLLHKFKHFKKIHGMNLCVGCGRCVDACPEYIDIRNTVMQVNSESESLKLCEVKK